MKFLGTSTWRMSLTASKWMEQSNKMLYSIPVLGWKLSKSWRKDRLGHHIHSQRGLKFIPDAQVAMKSVEQNLFRFVERELEYWHLIVWKMHLFSVFNEAAWMASLTLRLYGRLYPGVRVCLLEELEVSSLTILWFFHYFLTCSLLFNHTDPSVKTT